MDKYFVLLVDDDARVLRVATDQLARLAAEEQTRHLGGVAIETATTADKARELIRDRFFHLALVDTQLNPKNQADYSGLSLLEALKAARPSCHRVVISARMTALSEHITRQLHPTTGQAEGIVNKADPRTPVYALIQDLGDRWLRRQVVVTGADAVVANLRLKPPQREAARHEVEYLTARLFGQGEDWNAAGSGVDVARVELTAVDQGFSGAAVFMARCYSHAGAAGVRCILKFAPRDYYRQELARYLRYVRYRVELYHRAELLGHLAADGFGALCYNFAGEGDRPTSLADLARLLSAPAAPGDDRDRKEAQFFATLGDLQHPEKKGWYKEQGPPVSLGAHFGEPPYRVDAVKVRTERVGPLTRDLAAAANAVVAAAPNRATLTAAGVTLELPSEDLTAFPEFSNPTPCCVVHGDMHCGNILLGAGDRPNLIDFYSVGNGPRAVDFATLDGSVRLLAVVAGNKGKTDEEVMPDVFRAAADEGRVWAAVWTAVWADPKAPPPAELTAPPPADLPFWARASVAVGRLARRNHPDLTPTEYAATGMMWAMRLLKLKDQDEKPKPKAPGEPEEETVGLQRREKVRLLVWFSTLAAALRGGEPGATAPARPAGRAAGRG